MSRAMWSGSLNFGLVTILVRLHPARKTTHHRAAAPGARRKRTA